MTTNNILGVFAKSPLKPIEEHIRITTSAAKLLAPFFEAVFAEDWNTAAQVRNESSSLDKEADAFKRDVRINLPKGLF